MGYYSSMIVLIPAIIFTLWAQSRVQNAFRTYSEIPNSTGKTGAEAARLLLDANGLADVPVNMLSGGDALNNYFDPRNFTVNLSAEVYRSSTIAAVCIAAHEVGHAIQHAEGYSAIRIRNAIVPAANFCQLLAWPLVILGIIASSASYYGDFMFNAGVILFLVVIAFHLITLPVEFNASDRALEEMDALGIIDDVDYVGSKKVLRAAGMTYVAALATAIATLLRMFVMRGNRN